VTPRAAGLLLALAAVLTFCVGPLAWQVVASLSADPGLGLPQRWTAEAYVQVFEGRPFARAILNSLVVAVLTTALALALAGAAAFVLGVLRPRARPWILGAALAASMFPPVAIVSPLFLVVRALGLRDVVPALALPYASFALPLSLWVLTTYFEQLPPELYRAARVDGCSPAAAFRRVLLPLSAPGLVTTALLVFIFSWNEFLFALTFTTAETARTIPVAISLFAAGHREPWAEMAAASVVVTLPLLVLTLIFQRQVVRGLTSGAVKG
jgi:multiple sugar transport system permease protein